MELQCRDFTPEIEYIPHLIFCFIPTIRVVEDCYSLQERMNTWIRKNPEAHIVSIETLPYEDGTMFRLWYRR
jgi:hypothetical protein